MNNTWHFAAILILAVLGCKEKNHLENETAETLNLQYAKGFKVTALDGYKIVEVIQPYQGAKSGYTYLLVDVGVEIPPHDPDAQVIRVPVSSIVCTSTTHIPLIDYLEESETLIGFPSTHYISTPSVRRLIKEGKVADLGIDKGMNIEQLAVLKPDMVMGYTMTGDFGQFRKIQELGIPVVINAEYLERHPLGRAEWIKFMALFYKKETIADSIFSVIANEYQRIKILAEKADNKPRVLSGVVYGDTWFLPGGNNYAARLLKDASCNYLWADDSSNGFLELSFESVFEKAKDADLWIGVASYKALNEIKMTDQRYTKFNPFKTGQVYTYDARKGETGGSEFLEIGYLRPDIILKDLVKIAHPELLPDHELYFHARLK